MRYTSGAMYVRSPPASPNFVIKLECRMEYDECNPSCKFRKENTHLGAFYGVVGSCTTPHLVHLCYQ